VADLYKVTFLQALVEMKPNMDEGQLKSVSDLMKNQALSMEKLYDLLHSDEQKTQWMKILFSTRETVMKDYIQTLTVHMDTSALTQLYQKFPELEDYLKNNLTKTE